MSQVVAVAIGGAFGAVLRFFVSSGIYQWLGRGFPYGTLVVNVIGSLLIGLMTETLILQRVAISLEYRAALLVGVFGSFTTFSTFSLETLYLLEQGNLYKAALNILVSVCACILAVWLGLQLGRVLFSYSNGVIRWMDWVFPYGLLLVNILGAFIISMVMTLLLNKVTLSIEHSAALLIILVGSYITLSGLYLVLFLIEDGHTWVEHATNLMVLFLTNALFCTISLWFGLLVWRQIS